MENKELFEEMVDREVTAISALEWLEGYFEGLEEDHEAAVSHVETALNALKGENQQ